jgi:hypothetical protein
MNIETWRSLTILAAALGQTLFVLQFFRLPWWTTFTGKGLMVNALSFMLLVDVAITGQFFDWGNEDGMIVGLYGVTAFGVWAQLFVFMRQDRREREKEKGRDKPSHALSSEQKSQSETGERDEDLRS